jgi:prepilin-type processing-associated H-X9-DG protein
MPATYRCPSDPGSPTPQTSYAMIVGEGRISDGPGASRFSDITDGSSNTLVVVEASGSGINWMQPSDLSDLSLAGSMHPSGMNAAYADGSVQFIPSTIAPETLEALSTISGGEDVSVF